MQCEVRATRRRGARRIAKLKSQKTEERERESVREK